jgi:hypothetical protein
VAYLENETVAGLTRRGNARQTVFQKDEDFAAFLRLFDDAQAHCPMRVLAPFA